MRVTHESGYKLFHKYRSQVTIFKHFYATSQVRSYFVFDIGFQISMLKQYLECLEGAVFTLVIIIIAGKSAAREKRIASYSDIVKNNLKSVIARRQSAKIAGYSSAP